VCLLSVLVCVCLLSVLVCVCLLSVLVCVCLLSVLVCVSLSLSIHWCTHHFSGTHSFQKEFRI